MQHHFLITQININTNLDSFTSTLLKYLKAKSRDKN